MWNAIGTAIAVVVALIAGFYVYTQYGNMQRNNYVQDDTAKLQNARNELVKAYGNQPGRYGTVAISAGTLISLGAVSGDMELSTSQLVNPWSGQFLVTGNTTSFYVDQDNIPEADCNTLITNQRSGGGILSFAVGSTISAAASATPQAVPVAPTATGCVAGLNAVRAQIQ